MIIGKWYNVTQIVAMRERGVKEKTWGKVIWVHPERRFCVLQFETGVMECFSPFDLGVM